MISSSYQLNERILNDLIRLEILKTEIRCMDIDNKGRVNMANKVKSTNMFHLARMIGVELTLKDAEKAIEGKRVVTEDARGVILNNFKNAMDFNRANTQDSSNDLDINIILHINKMLLSEWREEWDSKLRITGEDNETLLDNWQDLKDKEIQPSHVQDELMSLIDWYKSSSKIHPIIRTAVVIYGLVRLAPFVVLNKLTAITFADYILNKNGYSDESFLPSIRNFDMNDNEYTEAWNFAANNGNDITLWLERFISSLANDYEFMKEDIEKLTKQDFKSSKQPFLELNKRQLKILRYFQTIPTVKREDYVQMMDVSTMTAFRDLDDLLHKKLIKVEGKGRGTKYMLTNR